MAGFKEMLRMSDVGTIDSVLEEYGFTARWEARAREEGREEGWEEGWGQAVKRLQKHGMNPAAIAEALELPPATVSRYLGIN
jgi:predicted transposase YdaD